jgi:hypothetical protein
VQSTSLRAAKSRNFVVCGPQSPFANIPVVIDNVVRWIGRAITRSRAAGFARFEATPEAPDAWGKHMDELLRRTVLSRGEDVGSWFLGANIPGKPHVVLFYFGGAGAYALDHSAELRPGPRALVHLQ